MLAALPEEETDDDDDEELEKSEAYLFRLCDRSEAEFTAILEGQEQYVTIENISDEEYDQVVQILDSRMSLTWKLRKKRCNFGGTWKKKKKSEDHPYRRIGSD